MDRSEASLASVVIVSYNTAHLLNQCLTALEAQKTAFAFEVIVVDNGSHDGSADIVAGRHPSARLIRNTVNGYFAPAVNQGAAEASGKHLLLLNSDVELLPGALELLLRPQRPGVAGVAPILVGTNGGVQDEYVFRRLPTVPDLVLTLLFVHRIEQLLAWRRKNRAPRGIPEDIDIEQPSAACLLIDMAVFRRLGGLDASMALWFNDVDLCKRIAAVGMRLRCMHDVRVIHHGGASIRTMREAERAERLYSDLLAYARKWHPNHLRLLKLAVVLNFLLRSVAMVRRPDLLPGWFRLAPRILSPLTL